MPIISFVVNGYQATVVMFEFGKRVYGSGSLETYKLHACRTAAQGGQKNVTPSGSTIL
jgi:hypothetical protein